MPYRFPRQPEQANDAEQDPLHLPNMMGPLRVVSQENADQVDSDHGPEEDVQEDPESPEDETGEKSE